MSPEPVILYQGPRLRIRQFHSRDAQALVTGRVTQEADGRLRARLHALGAVVSEQGDESGWVLELDLSLAAAERLAEESGGHPLHALLLVAPGAPTYNPDD